MFFSSDFWFVQAPIVIARDNKETGKIIFFIITVLKDKFHSVKSTKNHLMFLMKVYKMEENIKNLYPLHITFSNLDVQNYPTHESISFFIRCYYFFQVTYFLRSCFGRR